jgi:hypothetical protein
MENKLTVNLASLYMGCGCLICYNIEGNPVVENLTAKMLYDESVQDEDGVGYLLGKLILRPLEVMSEEEASHIIKNYSITGCSIQGNGNKELALDMVNKQIANAPLFQYLLSKGFDLGILPKGTFVYSLMGQIIEPETLLK